MKTPEWSSSLKNNHQNLNQRFFKANTGQNALSFIGPALWNKVPKEHNLTKHYLKELGKANF